MKDSFIMVNGSRRYCGPFQREHADLLPAPPKVIIDCGAFDGGDSYRFREWFPQARIVTIEPHPAWAKRLRDEGLEVFEVALSDKDGTSEFYYGEMHDSQPGPSGSLYRVSSATVAALRDDRLYPAQPIMVQTMTLAEFCDHLDIRAVDILHMDTEGAEPDIVAGFGDLRPTLVMAETGVFAMLANCPHTKDSFRAQMKALGYREVEAGEYDILFAWGGK